MNKIAVVAFVPLLAGAYLLGQRSSGGIGGKGGGFFPVTSRPGPPVATFDGQSLSIDELKAQIEEQTPFVRVRYASPEGKKEFLEGMVRFELLSREAQKKGYHSDPEVLRQHKKSFVAVYLQREFEEVQHKLPVDENELRKFYDDHKEDYVKPERVRIAHIFVEAKDAAAKEKRRPAAEAALAEARERDAHDFNAFGNVVRLRSEDAESRAIHGDLHYLSREELEKRVGPEVASAAFELKELGKIHGQLVEAQAGFHVLKLLGKESALDLKLEDVREAIKNRVAYDRRGRNYEKLIADLEKKAGLEYDLKALDGLTVNLASPTPTTPPEPALPPGTIPTAPVRRAGADGSPPERSAAAAGDQH